MNNDKRTKTSSRLSSAMAIIDMKINQNNDKQELTITNLSFFQKDRNFCPSQS